MTERASDEHAVKNTVEQLISAAGAYDLDSVEGLMAPNANFGWASLRDGEWSTSTMTMEDWLTERRAEINPTLYTEPVTDWTIHVDEGRLAFVRADATLFVGDRAERHNIVYVTLIKENGAWKFLTASYVGTPVDPA